MIAMRSTRDQGHVLSWRLTQLGKERTGDPVMTGKQGKVSEPETCLDACERGEMPFIWGVRWRLFFQGSSVMTAASVWLR
jgi:hypothetical protein